MMALQDLVLPLMLMWTILLASNAVTSCVRVIEGIMILVIRTLVIVLCASDERNHDAYHQDIGDRYACDQ